MVKSKENRIWKGVVFRNYRLQCYLRPLDGSDKEAPQGLSFLRSHLSRARYIDLTPVVGDIVDYRVTDDNQLVIERIHPRRNYLSRQHAGSRFIKKHVVAANLDGIIICQSIVLPLTNTGFLDRLLVFAESEGLPVALIWTKLDLLFEGGKREQAWKELRKIIKIYPALSYSNFYLGNFGPFENPEKRLSLSGWIKENNWDFFEYKNIKKEFFDDLEIFQEHIKERRWVIVGNSGVGKSTLIKKITNDQDIRIQEVNLKIQKGRHTTTQAQLYCTPLNGEIIDTAGLREFGLVGLDPQGIDRFFPEFIPHIGECAIPGCMHKNEPNCKIADALDENLISRERYNNYLKILKSVKEIPGWKKKRLQKGRRKREPGFDDDLE